MLLSTLPLGDDEAGFLELLEVLHHPEASHRKPGLQRVQGLPVLPKQLVQQRSPGRISQCLEHCVCVDDPTIRDHSVTCQPGMTRQLGAARRDRRSRHPSRTRARRRRCADRGSRRGVPSMARRGIGRSATDRVHRRRRRGRRLDRLRRRTAMARAERSNIGYALFAGARGKGYATHAMALLLGESGAHRLRGRDRFSSTRRTCDHSPSRAEAASSNAARSTGRCCSRPLPRDYPSEAICQRSPPQLSVPPVCLPL